MSEEVKADRRKIDLDPCSRCGERSQTLIEFRELGLNEASGYRIMCSICGNQPEGTEATVEKAAEAWNEFNTKKCEE